MIKCRACLRDNGCMVPFNDQHINYFNLLTNINVQLCDNLPQHLCSSCLKMVKSFIEFREKCILSNYVLIDSLESKHKIEIDVDEVDKSKLSENVKNESIKTELTLDNTDEMLVDENDHFYYELLSDFIKTENSEEQINTSSRRSTSNNYKRKKALNVNTPSVVKRKSESAITNSCKNIATKSKDTIFSCGLCSLTFSETSPLTIHVSSHKSAKQCNLCSQKFTEWPALLSHRLTHLTNKEKRCHICLKKFYKVLNLEFHYRKFHTEDKDYVVTCSECGHSFETPRKLQKHMWSCHSDKRFLCEHCPKVFKTKSAIRIHMSVHNVEHLECDLCDYTCRFSGNLKDHKLRKHTLRKAYCKKCTRVFTDQDKLEAHKCGEKGTICPICGKVGKTHKQLIRHMVSHDSSPRYKCGRCPKAYRSRSALTTHTHVHEGVRTKHCEYCSAKFYSGSVLIKHRRTHTGEKPYVCRVCCKGFTGNYNLKVHMKVHGEYLIEKKKTDDTVNE